MSEKKKQSFSKFVSELNGIKLTYGTANKQEQKYVYAHYLLPAYISFTKIDNVDYNRLMNHFHHELNRRLFQRMGNTSRNFGIVETPKYVNSNVVSKSLIMIEVHIENRFQTVKENLPLLKEIVGEMSDYIITKLKSDSAFKFKR